MKLSTRLAIAMVGLVIFTATAISLFTSRDIESAMLPQALERIEMHARLGAAELESYVRSARNDVLGNRGAVLIQSIIRAHLAGGVDPVDGSRLRTTIERLSQRFVSELESKSAYLQIRIIAAGSDGRELLRVERSTTSGKIGIVPEAKLQSKDDRDYVRDTLALNAGEVYFSNIDLNQEFGVIETPHVPVLRVATPLQTAEARPFGILIINIDLRPVFERIRATARNGVTVYVINERGDYLVHPDRSREFAFETGTAERIQDQFPDFARVFGAGDAEARLVENADGERVALGAASARFTHNRRAIVVESIPYSVVMQPIAAARWSVFMAAVIAAAAAVLLAILFAQSLSKPLIAMTAAVQAYGRGGHVAAPVTAGGEIGLLARAFERMATEIRTGSAKIKELSRRERFYIAAVESSNYAFLTLSPNGSITAWNPGAEKLFGYSADEAIGQSLSLIVPDDKRAESQSNRQKILRMERIVNFETIRIAKDSRRIDVVIDGAPIKSRSGHLLGSAIIARDVTGEKLAEEMFQRAVEACPTGMVMFDRSNRIVLVNTETERLFGHQRDELMGRPVQILVPHGLGRNDTGIADLADGASSVQESGQERDLIGVRSDGTTFPVEVRLNPIQIRDGLLVLGVIVDVSERRRNERMKDEFVSTVSHELRTPLTSIAGSLGLLTGGAGGPMSDPTMRLLKIAHKNSERLVRLINDILDIEKIESGKIIFDLKRVDVPAVIEQAIDGNRGFAEGFGVRVRLEAVPAFVRADVDRLVQVVTNLLSNAVKFSPHGGEVVVAIEQHAANVRIAVQDQGPGIPEEFRPRLFEKFAQADSTNSRQKGGTGLGLSIVKKIVTLLGGTVGFDCPAGGGTTFYVDLPRWDLVADSTPSSPPRAPHLLICDDDTSVVEAIAGRLAEAGFVSDSSSTVRDALAKAQAASYDAILVDLRLPDRDGISLIQDLRAQARYQNTPIVVISADAASGRDDFRSSSLDVLDWLNKPIDVRNLVEVLDRPLARGGVQRSCILHVDDDPSILAVVAETLQPSCDVVSVPSIPAARAALKANSFDFAVLDLVLSQASGLELLQELRNRDGSAIPVILYSARAANGKNAEQVHTALTKSHASIDHLIATLRKHVAGGRMRAQENREVA